MDPDDPFPADGGVIAERGMQPLAVAQLLLGGEGEMREVVDAPYVLERRPAFASFAAAKGECAFSQAICARSFRSWSARASSALAVSTALKAMSFMRPGINPFLRRP